MCKEVCPMCGYVFQITFSDDVGNPCLCLNEFEQFCGQTCYDDAVEQGLHSEEED